MSEKAEVLPKEFFRQCGAVIEGGHFVITPDGLHSAVYVDEWAVLKYIVEAHVLCRSIANRFKTDDVEAVIGLGESGTIIAPWTAQGVTYLTGRKVVGLASDKVDPLTLTGKEILPTLAGKNILVVGGVLVTVGFAKGVVETIRVAGGNVVGLGVFWNRGDIVAQDANVSKLEALVNVKLETWDAADCPLCQQDASINTKYGYGREFLASRQQKRREGGCKDEQEDFLRLA
jgi:orotate phosphoribosyltransferase